MTEEKRDRGIEDAFHGTVTVGERGQVVIPAEARKDMEISPGEKLLVFGHPSRHGLMMVKISHMAEFARFIEEALAHEAEGDGVDPTEDAE
jgi:AbrB family looped-hinge helix DNA binding protein